MVKLAVSYGFDVLFDSTPLLVILVLSLLHFFLQVAPNSLVAAGAVDPYSMPVGNSHVIISQIISWAIKLEVLDSYILAALAH